MVEGDGVEKMMEEGDGEEKDTALLLNSIVKGGRGLGCSTAAVATALPAAARARAPLGRLARFAVRDWSSDGGDLATAA